MEMPGVATELVTAGLVINPYSDKVESLKELTLGFPLSTRQMCC